MLNNTDKNYVTAIRIAVSSLAMDSEDPEKNYLLALLYEKIGQTASAITYFLRTAERTDDKELAYECLLKMGFGYDCQGNRLNSVKSCFNSALLLLPERPEAYYHMSKITERIGLHIYAYTFADLGEKLAKHEDLKPLRSDVKYPGKYMFSFQKAVTGWWWGKHKESRELFKSLYENYWDQLDENHQVCLMNNIKNLNVQVEERKPPAPVQPIPVIGTAVVNGTKWVKRLIDSVDYPVEKFVIFNNNGRGEIDTELDEIAKTEHKFIKKIMVCHLPANIGCAAAWNMIVKSDINAPYWIITNHDIAFQEGFLKAMVDDAAKPNIGMVHCQAGFDNMGSFECFLIKDWVIQRYGLFDENFYPAYCEDLDYLMKIVNDPIDRSFLTAPFLHGDVSYATTGSQTWRTDMSLKDRIDNGRIINEVSYMNKKWGPHWKEMKPYKTPFNKGVVAEYDLNFNRKKHLGF